MKANLFGELLAFLRRLDSSKIAYELRHSRPNALMVRINLPGERWEVEFLEDDEIEVERFISNGEIDNEEVLEELFEHGSAAEPTTEEKRDHHDAVARK